MIRDGTFGSLNNSGYFPAGELSSKSRKISLFPQILFSTCTDIPPLSETLNETDKYQTNENHPNLENMSGRLYNSITRKRETLYEIFDIISLEMYRSMAGSYGWGSNLLLFLARRWYELGRLISRLKGIIEWSSTILFSKLGTFYHFLSAKLYFDMEFQISTFCSAVVLSLLNYWLKLICGVV